MTAQICTAGSASRAVDVNQEGTSSARTSWEAMSMVEKVATVVSGFGVIGEARNALNAAGWTATITANRITVGEDVLAQLIPAKIGTYGLISAHWVIYSMAGTQPVWIVGAD